MDALNVPHAATLSTIHSAKGLEWESDIVLHAANGNIPSDLATESETEIEEERRRFYVALTRAKSHLHVLHPHRYYFHNYRTSDQHSQRTRLGVLGSGVQISKLAGQATFRHCTTSSANFEI